MTDIFDGITSTDWETLYKTMKSICYTVTDELAAI